jgi:hypothetical protein
MVPFIFYTLFGLIFGFIHLQMSSITTLIAGEALLGLIGFGLLVLAGILALLRPRAAACLALVGLVGVGQMMVLSAVVIVSKVGGRGIIDSGIVVPLSWLLGMSVYAVVAAIRPRFLEKWPAWIFTNNPLGLGQKILFWSLSASVIAFAVSYWLLVGKVVGTVAYEMAWDYPNEQKVVLTYPDYPGYFQICYSDELARYLKSTGKRSVPVVFKVIKDFGTIRGYYIQTVGAWENKELRCNTGGWDIKTAGSHSMGSSPVSLFMKDMTPKVGGESD